jgi:hypothetical protein
MSFARPAVLALVFAVAASPAFAQDDDLLSPLAPSTPKKKAPAKAKAKAPAKKAPPPSDSDDLLAPLTPAAKTELLVKLSGGLKGAKLFVDRKEVGPLPAAAVELAAGEHLVVVKRPGYADFSKTVNVAAGKQTEVTASLDAVAGLVTVTCDQSGAMVSLDGKAIGPAPVNELVVPPGEHTFTLRKAGFEDEVERVVVRAGRDIPVEVKMTPAAKVVTAYADRPERTDLNPGDTGATGPLETKGTVTEPGPLYTRWYVIAGAAAVVVAAAAGTAVAVSSANRPLTPETICQGPCAGVMRGAMTRF